MAGLAIFPIVFANGLEAGAGPGLVFVTLPIAFGLGWMIQKFLLNAVVGGPELTPLLMTFGLGLAMIYAVEAVFYDGLQVDPLCS